MSGYVQVDPVRLTSLAKKLHALSASLSAEPSAITGPYESWGGSPDFGAVSSASGRVATEADKMDDRAILAYAASTLPRFTDPNSPTSHMVGINWDYTEEQLAVASRQVAESLAQTVDEYPYEGDDPNGDAYNQGLQQRLRDIGDLLDLNHEDETFQQNFWPVAAPIAAKLADEMRGMTNADDNQAPLSNEWRDVLGQYSSSFAAATALHESGKINLPDTTFTPFTQAADEDMWSVGAFIGSGPSGDTWGSQFLADAGTRVLQWREDHQGEIPTFFQGGATSYVPAAYVGNDDGWYHDIGIELGDGTYVGINLEEQQRRMGLIAANDPALAILGKLGENQHASQLLLSDPEHGATNADRLVEYDWDYPGTSADESSAPGRIITAATQDRGADESGRMSAVAAGNVFDAVEAEATGDRSDRHKELYPRLPGGLQDAVTQTAITYIPDLAASSDEYQDVTTLVTANGPDGMHVVQLDASSVANVLGVVRDDPTGWGVFRGATDNYLTTATTYQVTHPDSPDYIRQAAGLDAIAQLTENNEAYDEAAARDAEIARAKSYYEAGSAILETAAATNHPYVVVPDAANRILGPLLVDPLFESSYADEASEQNARATLDAMSQNTMWIAQGLLNAEHHDSPVPIVPPPDDAPFMQGNRIVIEDEADRAAFVAWWNAQPASVTEYESDARAMYNEITKAHEDNIEQFGN